MELIIVTGLSGAGKSHAIHCMEDLGYYCVDNMPPMLMREFIGLAESASGTIDKVSFVVDIRGGQFFGDLKESLDELEREGREYRIMFLEASDQVLIRRYKETRRSHPLSHGGSVIEGIKSEREQLSAIRKRASFIIDTSSLKTQALNEEIKRLLLSKQEKDSFTITVESFGYKYGMPQEADWVLDARFIPNPYYLASMKKLTGNSKKVRDYVMRFDESKDFVKRVTGLVMDMIPNYVREGKYHLVLAIGCTGGQHRSVAIANEIANFFTNHNKHVVVIHRDL